MLFSGLLLQRHSCADVKWSRGSGTISLVLEEEANDAPRVRKSECPFSNSFALRLPMELPALPGAASAGMAGKPAGFIPFELDDLIPLQTGELDAFLRSRAWSTKSARQRPMCCRCSAADAYSAPEAMQPGSLR